MLWNRDEAAKDPYASRALWIAPFVVGRCEVVLCWKGQRPFLFPDIHAHEACKLRLRSNPHTLHATQRGYLEQ
jgi:hypothetical protein